MTYEIVDRHTGAVVGRAKTLKGAARAVDQRDNAYGAYRFYHRCAPVTPSIKELNYNRDLALRVRDRQVGSGMRHRP